MVAENCQSNNAHIEGIMFYFLLFLVSSAIILHFLSNFYFNSKGKRKENQVKSKQNEMKPK